MSRYTVLMLIVAACLIGLFFYTYRTPVPRKETGLVEATFGDVSLSLELSTTSAARELGLGGRASVPEGYGMLFVFSKDDRYGFWMKDTLVPLDIFWLDDQRHVVWMEQSVATSTYPSVFYPPVPARYVLETVAGFAALHSIATSTSLILQNPE